MTSAFRWPGWPRRASGARRSTISSPHWRRSSRSAAGIILSGTGSDGTIGLRAIKERGGLTLAQGSAEYDGMMRSAVQSASRGGNGGQGGRLFPPLQSYRKRTRPPQARCRRTAFTHRSAAVRADRPRFQRLQGQHDPAAHPAPHAGAVDR
ncbi:hypothetical protein EN873_13785 [bacterium M00.F.Ca.ET.230.01.1.1]|nr:hypothetical protein EN873_13785 [bacterium M00.F.Ca.ET.230.01.1.1]